MNCNFLKMILLSFKWGKQSLLRSCFWCAFGILLPSVAISTSQARTDVVLEAKIEVSQHSPWMLGDVVKMTNPTLEILRTLENEKLDVETSGTQLTLSQAWWLETFKKPSLRRLGLRLQVPDSVTITVAEGLSREELERKILHRLKSQCSSCDFEVQLEALPKLKSKNWQIQWNEVSMKSSFLLPLTSEGKTQWISVRQKIFREVPVSTRILNPTDRLTQEDVELKRMDVSQRRDGFLSLDQLVGQKLNHSMIVGSVIGASDILREPAIRRGQSVKAQWSEDEIEVSVLVQAEESGFVGDTIKLKTIEGKKPLMGVIKEKNEVVIQ